MKNQIWKKVENIAKHSNCKKRHVGCIIVNEIGEMKGAGYNYHENGICDCVPGPGTAKHAEIMAMDNLTDVSPYESLYAYINHEPCDNCVSELQKVVRGIDVNPTSKRLDEDLVNPKHYSDIHGVPSIEFFKAATDFEGFKGYLQLTSMKYLFRLNSKDEPHINAKKAQWFINKLVEELDNEPSDK